MRRDLFATCASLVLLAAAIIMWSDLYLFSKVIDLPVWASRLPSPVNAPAYLAFLCLVPAVVVSSTLAASVRAVACAVLIAPVPALLWKAVGGTGSTVEVLLNALFNYGWIVGFHCLVPALILLGVRAAAKVVKERAGG